jgi:hypothetical protein
LAKKINSDSQSVDILTHTSFGGCMMCNRPLGNKATDICSRCGDTVLFAPDALFPENNPRSLWRALHGSKDIWGQVLGLDIWPYPAALIDWVELVIFGDFLRPLGFGNKPITPIRGPWIVRSMPASFRLAGPFVFRKLTEEGALEVFAGRDGFYYRRIEGKLADHRYYPQSEMPPHIAALPLPQRRQFFHSA